MVLGLNCIESTLQVVQRCSYAQLHKCNYCRASGGRKNLAVSCYIQLMATASNSSSEKKSSTGVSNYTPRPMVIPFPLNFEFTRGHFTHSTSNVAVVQLPKSWETVAKSLKEFSWVMRSPFQLNLCIYFFKNSIISFFVSLCSGHALLHLFNTCIDLPCSTLCIFTTAK